MDIMNPRRTGSLLELILETVVCPVCLGTVFGDAMVCKNDHPICVQCRGDLPSCPTCREELFVPKQHVIRAAKEKYMKNHCKWPGCGYKLKHGDDHEEHCYFTLVKCSFPGCNFRGRASKFYQTHKDKPLHFINKGGILYLHKQAF